MTNPPVVLPTNKKWTQLNNGSLFGLLNYTRNIDLSNPGTLQLSRRMRYVGRVAEGGTLEEVTAIVFDAAEMAASSQLYYIINAGTIYTLNEPLTTFAVDATAGTPNTSSRSDGLMWNDGLYVTTGTNLFKLVAGVWTGALMTLTSGKDHPLCVSSINNYLLVGNGNKLEKRTTAGVNSTAITLPSQYEIVWIRSGNGRVFIGCSTLTSGDTAVFDWDEEALGANNRYDVDCNTVLSGTFLGSDFYVMSDDGRLMRFDGAGFEKSAQLPVYRNLKGTWVPLNGFSMTQRGMTVVEGKILMNLSALVNLYAVPQNNVEYEVRDQFSSGIWEFDGEATLNHKYGLSNSQAEEDFDIIAIEQSTPGPITPLYKDPRFGYSPSTSVGSVLLTAAEVRSQEESNDTYFVICSVTQGDNRGVFATQRVESAAITNIANKLWCKYSGVDSATDKILWKYRVLEDSNFPIALGSTSGAPVNWISSTSFTFTLTNYPELANIRTGYEVTVASGPGAGATAHVVSATNNAGVYTVVLDEAIPAAENGDESAIIIDNWVKIDLSITRDDTLGYKDIPIPQTTDSTWIQIKGELRGSGVIIEELQLVESTQQQSTS